MPEKTWIGEWGDRTDRALLGREASRLEGVVATIWVGDIFEEVAPISYSSRLYLVEELNGIYA